MGSKPLGSEDRKGNGNKEDARALNFFLDSLLMKVNECKTELLYSVKPVT